MKTTKVFFGLFLFLSFFMFCSATSEGTFIGNQTETINNISAEIDVVATLSATEYWVEVQLNTTEIDFGHVERNTINRRSYQIAARGNVDVKIVPTLTNPNDKIFSNLYFSRTTTGWKKINHPDLGLVFNLTQNKGLWTVIGPSDNMRNLSGTDKGAQNIQLDLRDFNEIIPFDQEYKNTVKFIVIPDWNSV